MGKLDELLATIQEEADVQTRLQPVLSTAQRAVEMSTNCDNDIAGCLSDWLSAQQETLRGINDGDTRGRLLEVNRAVSHAMVDDVCANMETGCRPMIEAILPVSTPDTSDDIDLGDLLLSDEGE